MKVVVGKHIEYYDKERLNIQEMFQKINVNLNKDNNLFSHLLIDNLEIHEEHEKYIIDNIDSIKEIKVMYISQHQLIIDTWKTTINYLEEFKPQANELAIDFYQYSKTDLWDRIISFIDIIDQLFQSFDYLLSMEYLDKLVADNVNWDRYARGVSELRANIYDLQNPMELRDTVTIADKITWNILPLVSNMENHLRNLLKERGEQ